MRSTTRAALRWGTSTCCSGSSPSPTRLGPVRWPTSASRPRDCGLSFRPSHPVSGSVVVILSAPSEPLSDGTVVVRLPDGRDVEALVRYGDDPDVGETIWVPIPTRCPREVAAARLAEFMNGWEQEKRFGPALIIADADTDEMIGVIFLRLREHDSIELTYGVAPAYRNRGVATAAAVLVSGWRLEELAAARVELRVGKSNLASQRVAAKAGFSREGIVRSHVAATGLDYDDLLFVRR